MNLKPILLLMIFINMDIGAQSNSGSVYIPECNVWYPQPSVAPKNSNSGNLLFDWQAIQTPSTSSFLDVFFIDSVKGWASHTGNGCMRTIDGGFTWATTTFDDTNFTTSYEGIFFIDKLTGWCVGGAIQIRKTTNGGTSWFKQYGPPVVGINRSVYFVNADTGYIAGSKNYPFEPFAAKTTNGGTSWTELDVSFPNAQELNDQYWFNADTGWICGYNALVYTTDGGATFVDLYSNVPPTGNGHNALLAIQFADTETGWIGAGNLESENVYKTSDSGGTWVFQDNPVSENGWNQINDVRFLSADSGWAAHGTPGTGAIMFTSNGGTEWVMDNTQYSWYDCFSIYQRFKIWCGGSDGVMWQAVISTPTGVSENDELPGTAILYQNYPNPFNPKTEIRFQITDYGLLSLKVYDLLGREIATLVNEVKAPGSYSAQWDAQHHSAGMYLCRMQAGQFISTRKLVLLR